MKHLFWIFFLASSSLGFAQTTLEVSANTIKVTIVQHCSGTPSNPACTYTSTLFPSTVVVYATQDSVPFTASIGTVGLDASQQQQEWLLVNGSSSFSGTVPSTISITGNPITLPLASLTTGLQVNGYLTISATVPGVLQSPTVVLINGTVSCTGTGCPGQPCSGNCPIYLIPFVATENPTAELSSSQGLTFASNGTLAQSLSVTNPVEVPSEYGAFEVTQSPPVPWLNVTSSNLTASGVPVTPASLTFMVDPTGLPPGSTQTTNISVEYVQTGQYYGSPTATPPIPIILAVALAGAPTITSFTPSSVNAGGAGFSLTVNGTGFISGDTVDWGNTVLSTAFVSSTQLVASVPASLIATAGMVNITVAQTGGISSAAASYTVSEVLTTVNSPVISSLTPASATAGGPAFSLTVNGSGFVSGSTVGWNGSPVATSYVSANQLSATIPASLIASQGSAGVTVTNPGSLPSAAFSFTIAAAAAVAPAITSVNPSSATAGSASVSITVNGSGFVGGASVQWNGLSLGTNFVSATTLTAQIPASDLVSPGTGEISVENPSGLVSNSVPFFVSGSSTSALQFLTVPPCRVLDTRLPPTSIYPAGSTFGSPYIAAGTVRTIPIPASTNCPVPANAAAYSLNFTVQPRTTNQGYLTVWPAGTARPNVSTVSFSNPAVVLAAAGIVPAGASGAINATATQDIDLIVDINGYFVPPATGTLQFYPLAPCRVLDTRTPANGGSFPANSPFGSPSLNGVTARSFSIPSSPGNCGAPANAAAYSFNVGVVPQGALYFLAAYPTGGTLPVVSTMNSFDGTTLANAAIVPAGPGGAVNFYASNPTDFFVDINGYFAPPGGSGGLNFYTVPPCRLVDTRNADGTFGGPTFNTDAIRSFPLPESSCGIPSGTAVQAYSLGITVYPVGGGLYYLTTWPTGESQPFASTLNAIKPLLPIANAALVPAGTGGAISVFTTNPTDVTIDTAGYFGP